MQVTFLCAISLLFTGCVVEDRIHHHHVYREVEVAPVVEERVETVHPEIEVTERRYHHPHAEVEVEEKIR